MITHNKVCGLLQQSAENQFHAWKIGNKSRWIMPLQNTHRSFTFKLHVCSRFCWFFLEKNTHPIISILKKYFWGKILIQLYLFYWNIFRHCQLYKKKLSIIVKKKSNTHWYCTCVNSLYICINYTDTSPKFDSILKLWTRSNQWSLCGASLHHSSFPTIH